MPNNYASYSEYKLTFHDTLSSGLKFNNDVSVVVYTKYTANTWASDTYYTYDSAAGTFSEVGTTAAAPSSGTTYYTKTTVNSGYSVETTSENLTDGCTFEVRIADVNNLTDDSSTITIESTSKIVVEYTAELLDTAGTTETNGVKLEYSNNPNDDGSGTGTTTEDITTVFTFTLDVKKVDEDKNELLGAGFTLYKAEEQTGLTDFDDGKTYYTIDSSGTPMAVDTTKDSFDPNTPYYVYTAVGSAKTGGTTFTFGGLGVGYYKLVESTTPTGYNTMDDMYFTIEAVTEEDSSTGNASVKSLTIKDSDGNKISGDVDSEEAFIINIDDQSIKTSIINHKGSSLPSTGGIGTTIFYVVGGVMVVGALTLLITRLRMRKRKSI